MVRRSLAGACAALTLLAACSAADPSPTQVGAAAPGPPVRAEDRAADVVLSIAAAQTVYPAGEAIDIETRMTYVGDAESVELWGPGGGIVAFDVRRLDGPFQSGSGMDADCAPHLLRRDEPAPIPFAKSGGFDPQDPASAAVRAYLADPLLRLPPGEWEITAWSTFLVGECAPPGVELRASIRIATE